MKPLHILFISPYLPSLIRVRPYNLIKHLAEHGHHITLLALEAPGEDSSGLDSLHTWCQRVRILPLPRWRILWNGVRAIPSQVPFQAAYSRSPAMADLIRQTQAETIFDVAHVEHLRGAELSHAVSGAPIVFDSVDSISLLFERVLSSGPTWRSRLLAKLDLARTKRYEGRLLEQYSRVLVTSPLDKDALADLTLASRQRDPEEVQMMLQRLVVLPNGVDLDYFTPLDLPRQPATVIFSGKMSYHANIAAAMDLATQVMPLVWQQLPEARLTIAGKDPSAELLALANDSRITVTGTVPDLRPCLAQATVAVTPMRYGVGIQNKVLEAMAMATPVVSTPQSLTALQAEVGQDVLAASTFPEIAQAVLTLLTDKALCQRLGQAGRRYVESHHDWRVVTQKLVDIYRQVMQ